MANFTQRALISTFMELLNERPLDKITVIDITKHCGVNRNTFYYHYHDIYDLLDTIFRNEEERILSLAKEDFSTWEESFLEGAKWSMDNKEAIYNVYHSSSRNRLERFLFEAGKASAGRFVAVQAQGLDVSEQDQEIIAHIIGATISGLVIEWLNNDMEGDPREFIVQAAALMEGSVRFGLEQVSK